MLMFLFVAEPQGAISESISSVPVSMETVFPLQVPAPGTGNVCATSSLPLTRNPSFATFKQSSPVPGLALGRPAEPHEHLSTSSFFFHAFGFYLHILT